MGSQKEHGINIKISKNYFVNHLLISISPFQLWELLRALKKFVLTLILHALRTYTPAVTHNLHTHQNTNIKLDRVFLFLPALRYLSHLLLPISFYLYVKHLNFMLAGGMTSNPANFFFSLQDVNDGQRK